MGKKEKVGGLAIGTGILIGGSYLIDLLIKKDKLKKSKNEQELKQQEKLKVFERELDKIFVEIKGKQNIFKDFQVDKVFLTRDEKFKVIENLKKEYENEFKNRFDLRKDFFDSNFELKGEREARSLRRFLEYSGKNKYKDKLQEISSKYDVDLISGSDAILGANKELIKRINDNIIAEYNILKAGIEGEKWVTNELSKFQSQYKLLSNQTIRVGNETVEFDNLVITNRGILIFEVKNIGARGDCKLIITKDGQYKKVRNGIEEIIGGRGYTPSGQVNHHDMALETILKDELSKRGYNSRGLDIKPIVVIANDNVEIQNESKATVIRRGEMFSYIKNNNKTKSLFSIFNKYNELSDELINEICDIISKNSLEETKFKFDLPKQFVYNTKSNLESIEFIKKVNELIKAYT